MSDEMSPRTKAEATAVIVDLQREVSKLKDVYADLDDDLRRVAQQRDALSQRLQQVLEPLEPLKPLVPVEQLKANLSALCQPRPNRPEEWVAMYTALQDALWELEQRRKLAGEDGGG
jgi:chromosome segregation ATPase